MTNLSDVFIGGAGALVTVLDDQTFNSSGTWTKPAGVTFAPADVALIELWGGGASGQASGSYPTPGGPAGAYLRFCVLASSLSAAEPVVVGAGGVSSSVTSVAGGDSSFAGKVAPGGPRAFTDTMPPSWAVYLPKMHGAGNGGAIISSSQVLAGQGSVYGGRGGDATTGSPGGNGSAPGGGGGASGVTSSGQGGNGANGRVRVRLLRGLDIHEIREFTE